MKKLFSVVLLMSISMFLFAQDLSDISNNLPKGAKSIVLSADIDIDGFPDVFLAGETLSLKFAGLYQNKGDSTFSDLGLSVPYLTDASACFADLNNDTYVDLLYTGIDESLNYRFYIFINQQNNTFIELTHSIPGIRFGTIQCQDMDHDGWCDIFISGYSSSGNVASLYKNSGNLTFAKAAFAFDGLRSCDAVLVDFDHNHNTFPDIIYSGLNSSLIKVTNYYQNQGNMQFIKKTTNLPGTQFGGVDACDVNNDGFMDIAIFGKDIDNNHITNFYKNNSGLSFTLFDELKGIRDGALKTSDYNNDGYIDVLITGLDETDSYTTELYINNGGTGFSLETDTITPLGYSDAIWFDFNQDQKNDLLICGTTLSVSKSMLLSSNSASTNQQPSQITGLSSETSADTVWLSWNKGIDNETSSNGLTYDIYLQTDATNSVDFYPSVDLLSGLRYLFSYGNFSTNYLKLDNLPDGKYYWSVQSVDAAFAGSSFATADTFYISSPIDLGNDTVICSGDTISFAFPAFEGNFKWFHSLNPGIPLGTIKEIEIEINQKDTIWVEITKSYGDMIYDTIIIDIHSLPVVNLGDDIFSCYGSQVELTLGAESDTVDWFTLSDIYQENNSHIFNHVFYSNDEIVAQLTDINGCTNSDTVILSIRSLPEINLVNDTSLCLNNTLQLNIGTASDSINWYSLSDASQTLNSTTFEYIVSQDNTFQVEWYDQFRCVNYDTINIFARALPIPDAGNDKLICGGYSVNLGPEILNDDYTYLWSPGLSIDDINSANPLVTPLADTEYFLHVTDQFGCQANDSVLVQINPIGTFNIGNDTSICPGEETILGGNPTAIGSILPYSFEWSPTEYLSGFTSANPVVSPKETTTYSLIIYTGDCPVDTLETTVTISPLPTITIMNDTIAGFQEDISLLASGGISYLWSPTEYLDYSDIQNPTANLQQSTYFTVLVINEYGCSDTTGVNIFIKNEVFIPELFTPNDDGNNDQFKIYEFGIKQLYLVIYDEKGTKVFESSNLDEITSTGWNGENNGNRVKDGKYFWKIRGEFYDGSQVLFKGKDIGVITILR